MQELLTVDAELLRYCKILKSSKRVQIARKMMGLSKGEYIIKFDLKKGTTQTTKTKGKYKKLTSEPSDSRYFYSDVQSFVVKEIIEFYDFIYPTPWILHSIFGGYEFVPEPFIVHAPRPNAKGNIVILIEIAQNLSPNSKNELLRLVKETVKEAKDILPPQPPDAKYERIESISNIDEKYALAKEYEELKKLPRLERKEENKKFIKKAASVFQKEKYEGYTLTDVVTDIRDFKIRLGKGSIR